MARHFGHVEGEPVGSIYGSRAELSAHGVHGPTQAGIWGTASEGASSIVLNGGYPDDEDHGDQILYTGHGGQVNGRQVEDQDLADTGNAAMVRSQLDGLPVRVTRGYKGATAHSPASGYRYDGLFRVVDHARVVGREGFKMWRFWLERIPEEHGNFGDVGTASNPPEGQNRPQTASVTTQRIVRTSAVAEWVKRLYKHQCQVCGIQLGTAGGLFYAEGAHIRPLGRPHYGPDKVGNVLCLCPNHHVLLDNGGFTIDDDYTVRDPEGGAFDSLNVHRLHPVDPAQLAYHRDCWM